MRSVHSKIEFRVEKPESSAPGQIIVESLLLINPPWKTSLMHLNLKVKGIQNLENKGENMYWRHTVVLSLTSPPLGIVLSASQENTQGLPSPEVSSLANIVLIKTNRPASPAAGGDRANRAGAAGGPEMAWTRLRRKEQSKDKAACQRCQHRGREYNLSTAWTWLGHNKSNFKLIFGFVLCVYVFVQVLRYLSPNYLPSP